MATREDNSVAYHEREAARFRRLAETATTPAIKSRLLARAEAHECLVEPAPAEDDASAFASHSEQFSEVDRDV
jgi:hypothetical protein